MLLSWTHQLSQCMLLILSQCMLLILSQCMLLILSQCMLLILLILSQCMLLMLSQCMLILHEVRSSAGKAAPLTCWSCLLCRKAKLQTVQKGQKICPKGVCFLFSGQLQRASSFSKAGDASLGPVLAGTHVPSPDSGQAGGTKTCEQQVITQETAMPLQGADVGSVAHPNASSGLSDDTEHPSAARVLQAPATFESDDTAVTCLQDTKVGR